MKVKAGQLLTMEQAARIAGFKESLTFRKMAERREQETRQRILVRAGNGPGILIEAYKKFFPECFHQAGRGKDEYAERVKAALRKLEEAFQERIAEGLDGPFSERLSAFRLELDKANARVGVLLEEVTRLQGELAELRAIIESDGQESFGQPGD